MGDPKTVKTVPRYPWNLSAFPYVALLFLKRGFFLQKKTLHSHKNENNIQTIKLENNIEKIILKKIYETIQPYCQRCILSLHHFFPSAFIFATSIFRRLQYFISILFSSVLHKSTDKPHSFDFKWQQGLSKNSSNGIQIYLVNFLFTTAEGTSHVICHYYTIKIHFIIFFPKSQLYIH